MRKAIKDAPELTDEEMAFEMIELTCDEMDSLARAFDRIAAVCKQLSGEEVEEEEETVPKGAEIH